MLAVRTAKITLVAFLIGMATLLPAGSTTAPAQAAHGFQFLQVTPEVSVLPLNGVLRLEAQLFLDVGGDRMPAGPVGEVTVNFEEVGETPASLSSTSCTIAALTPSCEVTASSAVVATTLFRAWIDDGTKDEGEGRLANTDPDDRASADCITPAEGESEAGACRASDDTPTPGEAEPDETDVVKASWVAGGVDVVADDQRLEPGRQATLTATAYDVLGNPAPGVVVRFEYFNLSISDGDGNNPGPQPAGNPDGTCTTIAAGQPGEGTCKVGYTQTKEGVDLLCVWTSDAPPVFAGTGDGGTCDGEGLVDGTGNDGKSDPAGDDQDVVRVVWQRAVAPAAGATPGRAPPPPPPPPRTGYWLVATDGGIFAFGDADFKGSTGAIRLNQPIVGMAAAPANTGYWLVASDGGIFAFGGARFAGSTGAIRLNQPIVGMDSTPTGNGYFLVARDGGVFAFGDARFQGSTGGIRLNQPIVGMAATPSGNGYWLVAADGGIFAFGDARFAGSTGALRLNQPIVGMAATPTGLGYWLVARDGGIFAFGDARFQGSTGALRLNRPIVGMSRTAAGQGYRLVASDGGIFAFGDARFLGSTGALKLNQGVVGMDGF